ncbi:MAG TPA: hypothetical protein VMU67_08365 [Steroidobacteraceae bacterium]|nr:hypothetical protein [Steroidobacteraceae bacterium]
MRSAGFIVKGAVLAIVVAVSLASTGASADPVRDWHDLARVHDQVVRAIQEMERARAANHYDMAGHGLRAEDLLRRAERQLQLAIDAAKASP